MLKHMLHWPDRSETSDPWREQLYELKRRLAHRLLAWEARSALEADHRCDNIGAAVRRGARHCLGRR
jgi:hypothetical protein